LHGACHSESKKDTGIVLGVGAVVVVTNIYYTRSMTLARGDAVSCAGLVHESRALAFALATLLTASATEAQADAPVAHSTSNVEMRVSTDQPGASIDIETWSRRPVPGVALHFHCENDCMLSVPPARYRLVLHRPEPGLADDTMVVQVQDSVMFRSAAPNHSTIATLGLALAIVGAALGASGVLSLAYSALSQICEGQNCGAPSGFALYGLTAAIAGSALVLFGLVVRSSHAHAFEREPPPAPRWRAGISPTTLGFRGYVSLVF
jgi:hypothetical protein